MTDHVPDLTGHVEALLADTAGTWWSQALARARDEGPEALPELFPALRRRIGTTGLCAGMFREDPYLVDLDAWRVCDAAGHVLLEATGSHDGPATDLFLRGDLEERTIVLKAMTLRPISPDTIALLGEVQRTNTVRHVEAGVLDANLAVRALEAGGPMTGFSQDDLHRLVLKLAFLDLPVARAYGVLDHATPDLSQMLEDFAQEREAAGRPVWADTWRFLGRAPIATSRGRLAAGLRHARPEVRAAARDGVQALGDADLLKQLGA